MIGFNWLKSLTISNTSPSAVASASTPERILALCQRPITLGELSDRLALDYRELTPLLVELLEHHQIRTIFLPKDGLTCLHYVAYGYQPTRN